MAQHIKLDQDKDTLILDVAKTALRTAKSAQTRKGGSAFYPTGDGQGVLVGDMADHGVDKWDPETGEQSPLWEGISQEELDAKADEILGAAKEDTAAQITLVNTTITEAQQAIEANREGIEAEAYLRAEGDKLAQDAAAAVKTETDRLSTKYDEMDTSVTNVKNDLKNVMTSTTQLEQDMIVSTLIEYAVGDSDTTPPTLATYWTGEPNNSVSVLSDPWRPDTPERTPGTYIWMRTRVAFGDGGQETSAPVLVTGNTGAQGPQGVPGEPGADGLPGAAGVNGKTSYLHLAYANSADGRTDFSTSDSNRDYIGQYTDFTQADSTDPSKYAWSKIKGAQGAQGLKGDPGDTGLPGAPGADGKTSYAHFAYANSADGRTGFSTTNGVGKSYIGQYVDFVEADSTDPTKYTWSLIVGPQGPQGPQGVPGEPGADGLPGAAGVNGKTSYLHLAYANSADGRTDFSTSDSNRDYIGQYTDFTQADSSDPSKYAWSKIKGATGAQGLKGDPGATGLPGAPGADGKTSYAHFAYANSADGTTDFSTTNGANKKYIGQYVDFVEADSNDPTKYTWSLIVGPQGPQGVAGAKGDKGDDGVTRYSYFAYGTSASGANFSKTPTAASTYIGVCVTTSATQPTDPKQYTWSLTKGNTGAQGPAGPQGAAGAKGDVGEDGKTWYTYFAYGTSASGANFSTTPTANSTYMGVCITLDATQPTTPGSYTWSLTKGNTGATGAQGVSVSALTPFWQMSESKPAQPVNKTPGGGWSSTEPAYVRGKKLWTCSRIDYSNGQWSWTSVQQSSAFDAAELALTTANGKNRRYVQPSTPVVDANELTQGDEWWQTSSKPPETYWMGEPNNSVSVLVDHSDEVEHIWVWNGTRWALNRLSAEDIIVSGSVAAGLVTADFFDGARIMGGEFVTSNELIRLNNAGLIMDGKSGERLVTLNATDGTATFQHVAIINGSLSVPTIEGGSIEGADYRLTTGSGATKQTIARINSDGVVFGDHLSYAKNKQGVWVLSLKGAIQSGGEISGPVITAPTIQTSSAENTGLKFTSGGLVAYDTDGNVTFTLDNTGRIMMAGALMSNASLTGSTVNGGVVYGATVTTNQNYASTDPTLRDRGVWIKSNGLVSYDASNRETVRIDAANGRLWTRDGISTNGAFSVIDMSERPLLELGADANGHATFTIYVNDLDSAIDRRRLQYVDHVGNDHRMFILWGNNNIAYITQTGWDIARVQSPCVDLGLQTARRGGLIVFRGRVSAPNSGDNTLIDNIGLVAGDGEFSWPNFETYGTNRSAVAAGFRNGVAQPCIVYIPATTRQLVAMDGPWDWVDLTGVTFGQ